MEQNSCGNSMTVFINKSNICWNMRLKSKYFALVEIHMEYVTGCKGCGTLFRYLYNADFLFWFG